MISRTNKTVTMKLWTLEPYASLTMNIAYDCDCDYEYYFLDYEHKPMTLTRKHKLLPMT